MEYDNERYYYGRVWKCQLHLLSLSHFCSFTAHKCSSHTHTLTRMQDKRLISHQHIHSHLCSWLLVALLGRFTSEAYRFSMLYTPSTLLPIASSSSFVCTKVPLPSGALLAGPISSCFSSAWFCGGPNWKNFTCMYRKLVHTVGRKGKKFARENI